MKSKLLYLIAFCTLSIAAFAQPVAVKRADKQYEKFAYVDAIATYERIAEKGYKSAPVFERLGNAYYFNAELQKAARWYGDLFALTQDIPIEVYYRYAQSLKSIGNYAKSDEVMKIFDEKTSQDKRALLFSEQRNYRETIQANSGRYEMADAGVNSVYADYGATVYKNQLVFTSSRDTGNLAQRKHKWNNQYFTNLYAAPLEGDSVGKVVKFAKQIRTRFHESSPVFSPDGQTMYFTRNNFLDGKRGKNDEKVTLLKIYKATRTAKDSIERWENITELPFNNDAYSTAHPAVSPDGTWLYFASDMPGGKGQSDLYRASIRPDGSMGTPENLEMLNTEARETFPFLSSDNELYFASDGYPGLGGLDIYMAVIKADGTFGTPVNIGAPANSAMDDFAYYIDAETRRGFLSSNRDGGQGFDDIYKFLETRKLICEQRLLGIVTDKETGEPIPGATVTLFSATFEQIAQVTSGADGSYDFGTVECGEIYYVRGEKADYETNEQKVIIPTESGETALPIELEKKVKAVTVGDDLAKAFGIKEIYFDFDKSNIRPDAAVELAKILDVLTEYPQMKLDIRSHTDARGSHRYNEKLSDRRAQSTRSWLIANGVDAGRLQAKGYGETRHVNHCSDGVKCSEEDHQLNRRSEFIITAMESF